MSLWGRDSQSSRASVCTYCYKGVRHTRTSQLSAGAVGTAGCSRVEGKGVRAQHSLEKLAVA